MPTDQVEPDRDSVKAVNLFLSKCFPLENPPKPQGHFLKIVVATVRSNIYIKLNWFLIDFGAISSSVTS